jgi:hypothetical protein
VIAELSGGRFTSTIPLHANAERVVAHACLGEGCGSAFAPLASS